MIINHLLQIRALLAHLPRCGPGIFEKFVEIFNEIDPPRPDIFERLTSRPSVPPSEPPSEPPASPPEVVKKPIMREQSSLDEVDAADSRYVFGPSLCRISWYS